MPGWKDNLNEAGQAEWAEFESAVRGGTAPEMISSAYAVSIVPDADDVDVQFAVELGLAIMLDKPIIAIAAPGLKVPDGLRRVAHAVVIFDNSTEETRKESGRLLKEAMESLPPSG